MTTTKYIWIITFTFAAHTAIAQTPRPAVTQGPGSAYSYGQQGGITAGTVNVAPLRLAFTDALGQELLAKIPDKSKQVVLTSIGNSNADQEVGWKIRGFLEQNGYKVTHNIIGMTSSLPDRPITLDEDASSYTLVVAPSAH
jgi:hypothetical protein